MKQIRKQAAAFTAVLLFAGCMTEHLPSFEPAAAGKSPLVRFAEQAEAVSAKAEDAFAVLQYDPKSQNILLDGRASGRSAGGFCVVGDTLMLDAEAAGLEQTGERYLSLEEAKDAVGCEVYESGERILVSSPFQSGTLIVAADGPLDSSAECCEYGGIHVMQYDSASAAYQAYLAFSQQDNVDFAEPNRPVRIAEQSENADANWGFDAVGADDFQSFYLPDHVPEITVAVIDTGIYTKHTLFKNRIAAGGTSFISQNEGTVSDREGHGTHCAGIICKQTPENVKIMPLKALDDSGSGDTISIYCAMMYAAEAKADIVSMSLGGYGRSPLLEKAAAVLADAGIPCVVAAGNESTESRYIHPGYIDSMITVSCAEVDEEGRYSISSFSNYGENIDFAAPGCRILSAAISDPEAQRLQTGTSMATPMVAACFANLLSADSSLTLAEMYDYLRVNALDLDEAGFDKRAGWGMVQMRDFAFTDGKCAKPEASVKGGTYAAPLSVLLSSATDGAEIYYTADGSVPTKEHGTLYDGNAIPISDTTDLRAAAYKGKSGSAVLHEKYVLCAEMPAAEPAGGSYESAVDVKLSANPAAKIYYTTDGSDPMKSHTAQLYQDTPIHIGETSVIRAVAELGQLYSPEMRASYLIGNAGFERLIYVEDGVLQSYEGSFTELDLTKLLPDTEIKEIGDHAFAMNPDLKQVILPDSVTMIGQKAFFSCPRLQSVTGKGVQTVGDGAFCSDTALKEAAFPKLNVIGREAFRDCADLLETGWDWKAVTEIGEYAFSAAAIGGTLELKSLKLIGAGAFEKTQLIENVFLPESITAIPDRLFCESWVTQVSAMGAETVGAQAFLRSADRSLRIPELPFEKIRSVGAEAFKNNLYDNAGGLILRFDSLETIGSAAFYDMECNVLSLPRVKHIPENGLEMLAAKMTYLESVETMEEDAVSFSSMQTSGLVFGSHLKEYRGNEIAYSSRAKVIAAPENSPVGTYFAVRDLEEYTATPALYVGSGPDSVQQYEQVILYAYPLGFGLTTEWLYKDGLDVSVPDIYSCRPDVSKAGTEVYQVVCKDADGSLCGQETIALQTRPVQIEKEPLQCNQPALAVFTEDSPETIMYSFTAEQDGDYYIFSETSEATVCFQRQGEAAVTQYGNGFELSRITPITLRKDETVTVFLIGYWECGNAVVIVADQKPQMDITNSGIMIDRCVFPVDAEITPDAINVSIIGMTQGTDYIVQIDRTNGYAVVCGIGRFCGMHKEPLTLYEQFPDEEQPVLSFDTNVRKCYQFIPKYTGNCSFAFSVSDETIDVLKKKSGALSMADSYFVTVEIFDQDWAVVGTEDNYDGVFPMFTAFLQARQTYYIMIISYDKMPPVQLHMTYGRFDNCITNASVEYDYYADYGFAPYMPKVKVTMKKTVLEEGKDYELIAENNELPGFMTFVLYGIGDYFGLFRGDTELRLPESEPPNSTEILRNESFVQTEKIAVYRYNSSTDIPLRLSAGSDVLWKALVLNYDSVSGEKWEWIQQMTNAYEENDMISLLYDEYYLIIWKDSEEPVEFVLADAVSNADISTASVECAPLAYTGKPLVPEMTVTLGGRLLTKGKDYSITPHEPIIACGNYSLVINGIGSYYGYIKASVAVRPDPNTEFPMLQEGDNTAVISEKGAVQIYRWIPAHSDYCIRMDSFKDAVLTVFDQNGTDVCKISGIGYQYAELHLRLRALYYVKVSYYDVQMTGSLPFCITADYKLLDRCTVTGAMTMCTDESCKIPETVVYDGDVMLKAGTDYEVFWQGPEGEYGYGTAVLHGIGAYVGELKYNWILCPLYESVLKMDIAEQLTLKKESADERCGPGHFRRLVFTAPKDGVYYLRLPSSDTAGVSTAVYLPDGSLMQDGVNAVRLTERQQINIFCMTNWLESDYNYEQEYKVIVSDTAYPVSYSENGYSYLISDGKARLTAVPEGLTGIDLPDSVIDSADAVEGVLHDCQDTNLIRDLADNRIVYCMPDGAAERFCREHAICYVLIGAECTLVGDVTGDGIIDRNDVMTLMRWLEQGAGMRLSADAYSMADLDADGAVTVQDLALMRGMAKSI